MPSWELTWRKNSANPLKFVLAIEAHHEEVQSNSIYGVLAIAADAVSAARPGARRETLESYIKRLDKLESIANLFKGVDKAFAIQAGRKSGLLSSRIKFPMQMPLFWRAISVKK
jgi:Predicted HD superfamily hydrolase